jgi:hypothetical protein
MPMTIEEKKEKRRIYIKNYYINHPDKYEVCKQNSYPKRSPEGLERERVRVRNFYRFKTEALRLRNILLD